MEKLSVSSEKIEMKEGCECAARESLVVDAEFSAKIPEHMTDILVIPHDEPSPQGENFL
jgi:hypothetical protein